MFDKKDIKNETVVEVFNDYKRKKEELEKECKEKYKEYRKVLIELELVEKSIDDLELKPAILHQDDEEPQSQE